MAFADVAVSLLTPPPHIFLQYRRRSVRTLTLRMSMRVATACLIGDYA
jgi:hypothetical protein